MRILGRAIIGLLGCMALGLSPPIASASSVTLDASLDPTVSPTDAEVSVLVGQTMTLSASGSVQYGSDYSDPSCAGYPVTDPQGDRSLNGVRCSPKYDPGAAVPSAPIGALIAKVGSGSWFGVGGTGTCAPGSPTCTLTMTAPSAGEVYVGYNDSYWADNSGSYSVTVSIAPPQTQVPTPPAVPTLTATATTPSTIHLQWIDSAGDESGFQVQMIGGNSRPSDEPPGATTGKLDWTGLNAGQQSCFQVRALNKTPNGPPSAWSKPACANTFCGSSIQARDPWAGYVACGNFTSVAATWTVPRASGKGDRQSAFWVGLGGVKADLEQIGTSVNVDKDKPAYYAWSEFVPDRPKALCTGKLLSDVLPSPCTAKTKYAVAPGDVIHASVRLTDSDKYTFSMTDVGPRESTKAKWSYSAPQPPPAGNPGNHETAEVIAEDVGGGPLTNFGNVTFSDVKVDGAPIGHSPITKVTLSWGQLNVSGLVASSQFSVTTTVFIDAKQTTHDALQNVQAVKNAVGNAINTVIKGATITFKAVETVGQWRYDVSRLISGKTRDARMAQTQILISGSSTAKRPGMYRVRLRATPAGNRLFHSSIRRLPVIIIVRHKAPGARWVIENQQKATLKLKH